MKNQRPIDILRHQIARIEPTILKLPKRTGLSHIARCHCILTDPNVTDFSGWNSLILRPDNFYGYSLLRKSDPLGKGIMLVGRRSRNEPCLAGRILDPKIFADFGLDL